MHSARHFDILKRFIYSTVDTVFDRARARSYSYIRRVSDETDHDITPTANLR